MTRWIMMAMGTLALVALANSWPDIQRYRRIRAM
jgi:hypothetical protein